jgi:HEAT repeat protein
LESMTVSELIAQLQSDDLTTWKTAAIALGEQRTPESVDALLALLAVPGDPNHNISGVPPAICRVLGQIGDSRAVPLLIECIDRPFLAGPAIDALKVIRDPRAFEPILRYFIAHPHSDIATVLGNWGDTRAVPALLPHLESPDPHLRFYVARALGKLGDERALPALERARNDRTPILDTKSLWGKCVGNAAQTAIERILARRREK